MPKTPFSTKLIGEFSLTADASPDSSFVREGKLYFQLRDRFGRWIDMGKGVKFKIRLKNGKYHSVLGVNTGKAAGDNTRGLIKVENDPYLPNGNYPVSSANLQQYIGLLTEEELAEGGIELGKDVEGNVVTAREDAVIPNIDDIIAEAEDVSSPTKELRTEITGDEIQDIKISSIAKALKAEGRFPVPRQSSLDTWGKTSDVTKGAKLDYAKVYEGMSSEDPEFAEKYPTFNGFWDRVVDLAVDERTQSPNELDRINQEMKEINKGYAKHVMGLDPDNGTFTVYRNAINNAFEEKDAAVGYVSTSRNLAFDYNANTRVGEQANGRYEITVKPDEVNGMIGYSQVEDEYALTIGQGVTYQEGRVKKVGELETVKVASWYEEAVGKLKRGQGATPFRGHSFVGQFDFLPISKNPMQGDKLQDFLDDNNITMDDWKNKFDELHGEGAYQRFKDSGRENQVSLQSLQKMFVDLGDGTYGLDVTQMSPAGNDTAGGSSFGDVQNTSSFVNDYVDNKLKFLSLIQEITGEPFMVHKNNSRAEEFEQPQPTPEPEPDTKINVSELPEGSFGDGIKEYFDDVTFDIKEFTADEDYAIYQYQGSLYELTNKFARENPKYKLGDKPQPKDGGFYLDSVLNTADNLDSAFKKSSIGQDLTVYRGAHVSSRNYEEILELKKGDYINDSAYLSTSGNPDVAKEFANLGPKSTVIPDTDRVPVLYKINLKQGQSALKVRDHTGQEDFLDEEEVLLPRNSKIKVTNLSKSIQTVGGEQKEVLLIEAEYETEPTKQPSSEEKAEELPISTQKIKEIYDDISNLPTEANEKKLAKDLYDRMLSFGLTTEEIASADPTYKSTKDLYTYKGKAVPLKEQEELALEVIERAASQWNASTAYDSVEALQNVAQKIFNPQGTYKLPTPTQEVLEYAKHRLVYEGLLRAIYDNTQKYFADNNIKKLVVYRGLSGPIEPLEQLPEGEIESVSGLQGAPIASWTLDRKEAGYFAGRGTILRSEIPVSSVLSMPFTGLFGVHTEQELLVLGMPSNTVAAKYDRDKSDISEKIFDKFKELDDKFDSSKPFELESKFPLDSISESLAEIKLEDLDPSDKTFDDELEILTTKADLTEEEIEALREYTGDNWHTKINNYLRTGRANGFTFEEGKLEETREKLENQLEALIKPLDEVVNKTVLLEDTVLYRGMSAWDGGGEFGGIPEEILNNLANNKVDELIDKGFVSTSYNFDDAQWFGLAQASSIPYSDVDGDYRYNSIIVYKINAKKGQKAYQVTDGTAAGRDEKEIILPRNTKFNVLGYTHTKADPEDPDTYDEFVIEMDIVEPAEEPKSPTITAEKIKEIYNDPKNLPTEDEVASQIYDLMISYGLTPEELAELDVNYEDIKKLGDVTPEELKEIVLDMLKKQARIWNGPNTGKAIQAIAHNIFNPEGSYYYPEQLQTATSKFYEAFLKAIYENTQKFFADRGIKSIPVYRGIRGKVKGLNVKKDEIKTVEMLQGEPMASWSLNWKTSASFAGGKDGLLIRSEIPVSKVLSIPHSGLLGVNIEEELVVLGMPKNVQVNVLDENSKFLQSESYKKYKELDESFDASSPPRALELEFEDSAPEPSQWDGLRFDPDYMEDSGDTAYYIQEPNPPAITYHVAPRAARQDILKSGLDPNEETWNTGLGAYTDDIFQDDHLWTKNDDGEYWAYEYRPVGIYMFESLEAAKRYAGKDDDIYQIDTVSNNRQIIRDPSNAFNWQDQDEEDRAYVTRYVQPESLKLLDNSESSEPVTSEPDTSDIPEYKFENNETGWKYSDEHVVGTGGKDRPTDEELDAIETYIGKGYSQMNDATRGYDPGDDPFPKEDIDVQVENLTNLIDRNPPLGTTAFVYRGVYDSVSMKYSELEVGDEFVDKGFVSTTSSVPTARGFGNIQLEIELGEDTKAIDVSQTVEGTRVPVKEPEIILQRGTTFEVVAKTENGFRLRVVGMARPEVVEPQPEPAEEKVSIPLWSPEYGNKIPTLYHGSGADLNVGDIIDYKAEWNPAKMGGIFSKEQDELDAMGYATKKVLYEQFVFASDDFAYAADYAHTPRLNQFEDPEDAFVYEVEPLDPTSLQHLMVNEIGSPTGYRIVKKMNREGVEIVEPEPEQEEEPASPILEFTDAEEEAIESYTDQGYEEINKHLRDGAPISEEGKSELKSLLSLIDRSPLKDAMTVYRGRPIVNPSRFAEINELKPGDKYMDLGIMSTSFSKEQADFYLEMELENLVGRFMLEIELPVGAKAFVIPESLASYGDIDKEVLLPPKTIFEVVEVTVNDEGVKKIKLKPSGTSKEDTDVSGVIDVVSEEATKKRLEGQNR
jgi:hypothetical protein